MSILTSRSNLEKTIAEEYIRYLKEEGEMSRAGVEMMRDLAYDISKKLAREIEAKSMSNQIDGQRLLAAVIDQVKLQMKE